MASNFNLGTILTIATVAMGAFQIFSGFAEAKAVDREGRAAVEAARVNAEMQIAELTRQQEQVKGNASEQVSDRVMAAKKELAAVTLAGLERGTGLNTLSKLQTEVAFFEEMDITRIYKNAEEDVAALEAQKKVSSQNVINTKIISDNRSDTYALRAKLGVFSTGLQVGAGIARDKVRANVAANIIP